MRILLLVPPFHEDGLEMSTKESIGVCYLAAVLRNDGFEVDILDADLLKLDARGTVEMVRRVDYDLIGFSVLEGTIESSVEILEGLRAEGVGAHVVWGGYFPTLLAEEILQRVPGADSVIMGEGEAALLDLARRLDEGKDWNLLDGLVARDGDSVRFNAPRKAPRLDDIPFPSRDLLPEVTRRGGVVGIVGSRGCFASCSFCCIDAFNEAAALPKWRGRSPENIIREIQALREQWDVRLVSFYDSNFIGPGEAGKRRAYEIGERIKEEGGGVRFAVSTRPDQIDEELFRALKAAGLVEVFIGIESMSQKSLDLYRKRTTVQQNRNALEILEKLEIRYRPGFILYEPHLTLEQIRENIEYLHVLINSRFCEKYHFFKGLRPYRGSPMEKMLSEDGTLFRNGWRNGYRWRDPAVERFIRLTGSIGVKMLPALEKANRLEPADRDDVQRLLGKWSIDLHEEVLDVIASGQEDASRFIDIAVKADKRLARIERSFDLCRA